MHRRRYVDFRRGRRLGKYDHVIVWTRPQRPQRADPATCATIPPTHGLREIRCHVVVPGRRTQTLTVVTTHTDADECVKEEIAELYDFRWYVELDIRSIEQSLNLAHVRCRSPEMVCREFWTAFLAHNLIRTTAATAAVLFEKPPRQLSFAGACQYVLSSGMLLSCDLLRGQAIDDHCLTLLEQIAECEVANRPGRLEPRVRERSRHGYKPMQKPRTVLQSELRKTCT
jgi:putative transposase